MSQSSNRAVSAASTNSTAWHSRAAVIGAGVVTVVALGAAQSPAQAGTDAEWDRLASCESGNRWDINTGNGYHGGLQFSKGSWDWAGGTRYATYPHQATREQQIAIAERLLDRQHISNAWPACSAKMGLTHADLQSGSATPPGGTSAPAPTPAPTPSTPSSDATHRVRSGDTLSLIARQQNVSGGWSAIYNANRDRLSNPNVIRVGQVLRIPGGSTSTAAPTPSPSPAPAPTGGSSVTVRSGDTLSRIARDNGVAGGWSSLYAANRDHIANPNLIRVGQVLQLP